MEEYLENMRSLRSYMNDVEEEAAKLSAEEQRQRTAIGALDTDIVLVKAQAKQAEDEAEKMVKAKTQVGLEMAEKKSRIAALELECATLKQTLELLHQEISITSAKFNEKRLFYTKTMKNLTVKLQEQQDWLCSYKNKVITREPPEIEGGKQGELRSQLESAQLKLEDIKAKRSALFSEMNKSKEILEQEKIVDVFPAALQQMDMKSLEEECKALQCDKARETEYFHSLQERTNEMKRVSDAVKCLCGLEYKVELSGEDMDIG